MMTEEQILSLVEEYFVELNPFSGITPKSYAGRPAAFVKFALAIHEDGYNKGYDDGFDASYIGD
jgi:hypothetical protein